MSEKLKPEEAKKLLEAKRQRKELRQVERRRERDKRLAALRAKHGPTKAIPGAQGPPVKGPGKSPAAPRREYRRGKPVVSKGCKNCHNAKSK